MNRPTRITLISAAGVLIATGWISIAKPQDAGGRVRQQFDDCFYASVKQQWTANFKLDPNIAAETAFSVCATEEQAMYSVLGLVGVSPEQAHATVVGIKLKMKRAVREVMADPAGYYQKHK